jgi:methanogenic corrinoid protein MtbC1
MKAGMFILRPLLAETGAPKVGKMVIGTVKGDIHDIGKNLVSMMMEGAGFEVVDLGINNAVEKYMAAIEEHGPDILWPSRPSSPPPCPT